MESKAESKFVEHITIDFYGKETFLQEDLHAFTNLFPKDLYRGIDEYWDRDLEESFVRKQRSMIQFFDDIAGKTSDRNYWLDLRKTEYVAGRADQLYQLITASKFSITENLIYHASALLSKPNIHYIEGYHRDNDDFSKANFYTSYPKLNNLTIWLTNDLNSTISKLKLQELDGDKFFTTCTKLYEPSEEMISSLNGIPERNNQLVRPQCLSTDSFPAGTVFKNKNVLKLSTKFPGVTNVIKGVYHVKGINWNATTDQILERQIENIEFVETYYTKILEDFFEEDGDVLFLEQIPDWIEGGKQGTVNGLVNAVCKYNLKSRQHVIVGMRKPLGAMPKLPPKYMLWYNLFTYNPFDI